MIPQSFIDDIQTRTDIVEVISNYIPLKRAGRNFKANCPFHGEKTPSFMISPQKQIFHCFGCGEGGGVIQFLMMHEKMTFVEAVEILAKRLGIEIPHQSSDKDRLKSILYNCLDEASLFYHKALFEDPAAKPVVTYLNKRGINSETIKKFRIGYSLGRNSLIEYMRKKNFTLEILERASLAISHEGQGYRDLFRERVMFPIFDIRSRVIGFGARTWKDGDTAPKYINSIESQVYSKRDHLFGFNFSKEDIAKADCAIIVEGYLDMIMPYVSGIKNIVASLGTALTLEQIRLIRRYTNNVTLVYDSDKAGQLATLRALDLLLESDLKVKIVGLPSGFDPDSLVRAKPKEEAIRIFSAKKDFFDYKVEILSKTYDAESIEGKSKIAQEIFSTLNKLNSEIEKYEYIKKLSFILRVKEEILIAEFKKIFSKTEIKTQPASNPQSKESFPITEKVLLKFMFSNKKAFPLIRKNLREEDFSYPLARKTVSYFLKNYNDSVDMTCNKILGAVEDKEISGFISKILMEEDAPLDSGIFKSSIMKLRQKRARFSLDKLMQDIKDAEVKGDKDKLKVLIGKFDKMNSEVKNA
ncbi:MAG: DNA primase [Candidatus Omnitrophica bacterium]|jgi:DNA primase|nr:DNA primase [Candidatus Omnitrophota bacterium]